MFALLLIYKPDFSSWWALFSTPSVACTFFCVSSTIACLTIVFCFVVNEAAKGVSVTEGYTGCVRNLISKKPGGEPQTLYLANPLMMGGNLYLGGCPYK